MLSSPASEYVKVFGAEKIIVFLFLSAFELKRGDTSHATQTQKRQGGNSCLLFFPGGFAFLEDPLRQDRRESQCTEYFLKVFARLPRGKTTENIARYPSI